MNEFEELFNDEFFIIDSDNLISVKSKLYGYSIKDNKIITNENIEISELGHEGSYIYIYKKTDNTISIYQDFSGSYGIYLFKNNEGYFCLSNSFIKLVDYLKYKHHISLNMNYAKSYLASTLCSFAYKQTLVNEIEVLPRQYTIHINLETLEINYEIQDFKERSIDLNSKEGIETLDKWFYKWTSLFSNLKKETNNITTDLSGGFDTRVVLSLILSSKINLDEITIHSSNDGKYVHDEDFKIASQIANFFNFKLNDSSNKDIDRYYFKEMETPINLSFYIKLGFHNQMYYKYYRNNNKTYLITGCGGENIRDYEVGSDEYYIKNAKNISNDLVKATQSILEFNHENLSVDYPSNNFSNEYLAISYNEIRNRYHHARASVEGYFANIFSLNPLMDHLLYRLKLNTKECNDKDLLVALIFSRYCPELLDFEFEGNRTINKETIKYAKEINEKFPFKNRNTKTSNIKQKKNTHKKITNNPKHDIDSYLQNIFLSNSFKRNFEMYFSHEIYNNIIIQTEKRNFQQLQNIYPAISIIKIINDVNINQNKKDLNSWLNKYLMIPEPKNKKIYSDFKLLNLLLKYVTARIDIINKGNKSSIDLIYISDNESDILEPQWLDKSKGYGIIIQNNSTSLKLVIKANNQGNLKIFLRGIDLRDKNQKKFPIYIDYKKLEINQKIIFDTNHLVSHDKPYIYSKSVDDGEIITIKVEWIPFNNNSIYNT